MLGFNENDLHAVKARLQTAIDEIVVRHRSAGEILTWNLLHEIEDEAFEIIQNATDLDHRFLGMMKSAGSMSYPRSNAQVDFGESGAMPLAFFFIDKAFRRIDA